MKSSLKKLLMRSIYKSLRVLLPKNFFNTFGFSEILDLSVYDLIHREDLIEESIGPKTCLEDGPYLPIGPSNLKDP